MSIDPVANILSHKALLAPMLATTDIPFRTICREYGAAHVCTEMVSAKGIVEESKESFRCAVFDPEEGPVSIQIVAADAGMATLAVRELSRMHPAMFDVNCGCPNDRICEAGAGAQLLENPSALGAVVQAVVRASSVPVSVKIRTTGMRKEESMRVIVRVAEDAGASMINVHARSRNAAYEQPAQWDAISIAKDAASIPVIGNGDVFSSADAHTMMEQTGCDGVMIARGALGTPWIFRDIAEDRRCSIDERRPPSAELSAMVLRHITLLGREFGPILAVPRIRKHVCWYTRHYAGADELRHRIFHIELVNAILEQVRQFFEADPVLLAPESRERTAVELAFRRRVLYWLHTLPPEEYIG
jgi:nifR3 family TIM-barrel protein